MPKFCKRFNPPSRQQQLTAIGLDKCGRRELSEAMCRCLDPSGGEWEDIETPEPNEWLDAMLDKTPDQCYQAFVSSRPNIPNMRQRTIYLQPLCSNDPAELEGAAFPQGAWPSWDALESAVVRFYAPLLVKTLPPITIRELTPRPDSRQNSYGLQYNATQIMDALLRRNLPGDAYCTLAVTMADLFPRPEWNFVYGLARLQQRIGVFSFVRHTPDPESASAEARQAQMLHRSMKTMIHEIGHMFGLRHCTWFNCLMRGSNGEQVEHQHNYLHLCPVCLRKLHSSIGFDVVQNYKSLLELFQAYEADGEYFRRDCEFLRQRLAALEDLPTGATAAATSVNSSARRSQRSPGPAVNPRRATEGAAGTRLPSAPAPKARASRSCVATGRPRSPLLEGSGRAVLQTTTTWRVVAA